MGELANCPNCNALFVKSSFRSVCESCYKQEEQAYETVYKFLRKRDNRQAKMDEVCEGTGVSENLILKFIHSGRIQLSSFPNLGYPCEKCGTSIRQDRICTECKKDIAKQLNQLEQEKEIKDRNKQSQKSRTFYSY